MRSTWVALSAVLGLAIAMPADVVAGPPAGDLTAPSLLVDTPVGFASVNALGQNGTTGGAAGPTVTVTNATDLAYYAGRNTPYVIQVAGRITFDDMITVVANKTVIGVGSTAEISGGGLQMGSTTRPGNNVIVRNIRFTNASDDSISVTNSAHHVWIDHNEFSNGFDGLLDIKRASDFVTVSWNRFHSHSKAALLGHSDTYRQDIGHLRVTYHHNFFDGTEQRHPRVRFGDPVHVYNNYYLDNSLYGVASTMDAGVLVEGNYFQNVAHPSYVGYDKSGPGRLVERNNIYLNSGAPQTAGTVVEPRTYYDYTLDNPADVPAMVRSGAGVGRISAPAAAESTVAAANSVDGFASVNALGQNGTTGGAGGQVVTATTTEQFLRHIDTIGRLIIQVSGRIAIESKQGVRPHKTIIGLGTTAEITGGGLDFHRSFNVIIRNIRFTNAEDDAVNVGQNSHHIWVDHNEFAGPVDGAIDVVRGADYVTVSWNWFRGTDKTMLIGHSDGSGSEDTGHLKVTIHHNFFDGSNQRHPRVRFGEPVHVYNNYYRGNGSYGVATTMNAGVLVEGNYFENVPSPILVGYGDSGPGRVAQRNNTYVNSGTPQTAGTVAEPRSYYSYTVDNPANVPASVRAGVGAGKI